MGLISVGAGASYAEAGVGCETDFFGGVAAAVGDVAGLHGLLEGFGLPAVELEIR